MTVIYGLSMLRKMRPNSDWNVYLPRSCLCLFFSCIFITLVLRFLLTDLQRRNEQEIPLAAGMAFYLFLCCLHPLSHFNHPAHKQTSNQASKQTSEHKQTDRQNRTDLEKCAYSRLTDKQANYPPPHPPQSNKRTNKNKQLRQ